MKPLKSKNLDKHLLNTISYFSFFGYPPSLDEIHTFFPKKITKNKLKILLERLVRNRSLICHCEEGIKGPTKQSQKGSPRSLRSLAMTSDRHNNLGSLFSTFNFQPSTSPLYTLPQYTTHFKNRATRQAICQKKLIPVKCYTGILAKIPFIRFIGITGSASMGNTTPNDDVDIFIITSKNCLFIGRFFAILIAHILHVRKGKNSVCLNLFFDESDLAIPLQKQTPYVAHEVLQMKPMVNKDKMYEGFLRENKWVSQIFPNATLRHPDESRDPDENNIDPVSWHGMTNVLLHLLTPLELILKQVQLAIIRRNKTGLIISPTQLWLFKKDFEKRMNKF